MKQHAYAWIVTLISIMSVRQLAHAETTVHLSNQNDADNTTRVTIYNNVSSSSNTSINSYTKTTVHIENNGEVNDFKTEGNESVDWQSSDGKSHVKINTHNENNKSNNRKKLYSSPQKKQINTAIKDEDKMANKSYDKLSFWSFISKPQQYPFIKMIISWFHIANK